MANSYLYRNYNDGSYTRREGDRSWTVLRNDPRYGRIEAEYAQQNGGIAPGSTINNPTGYSNAQRLLGQVKDAQTNSANSQTQLAVDALNRATKSAEQQYDQNAQQQYIGKMMAQKNIGQQLAANGLGQTGMSETTRLDNESNYLNNLNQNELDRQQARQQLGQQIAAALNNNATTLAEIEGQYGTNLLNSYQNGLNMDYNQLAADRDYRSQQDQLSWQQGETEKDRQLDRLMQQINLGYIGPEARSYYGIPNDYAALFNRNTMQGLSGLGKSNGGGGGSRSRSGSGGSGFEGLGEGKKEIQGAENAVVSTPLSIASAAYTLANAQNNRNGKQDLLGQGPARVSYLTRMYTEGLIDHGTYEAEMKELGYGSML